MCDDRGWLNSLELWRDFRNNVFQKFNAIIEENKSQYETISDSMCCQDASILDEYKQMFYFM